MKSTTKINKQKSSSSPRIPHALQQVFINSNKGVEVHEAPPDSSGCKVFSRLRISPFSRRSSKLEKGGSNEFSSKSSEFLVKDESSTSSSDLRDSRHVPTSPTRRSKRMQPSISPQVYLDNMIKPRGYSTQTFSTLESAYYNKPTELQKASYGVKLVEIVRKGDATTLRKYLASGLSPNPCNAFGESIVHMVCRLGNAELLQVMIDYGCELRVADDYGRTPLHDACWGANPSFEVVQLILKQDIRMIHMTDSHGALPLSYTRREHWNDWLTFLASAKEEYWPKLERGTEQPAPLRTLQRPNSLPIPDPPNALTSYLAGMVASGKIDPDEAKCMNSTLNTTEAQVYDDSYGDDDDEASWGDNSVTLVVEGSKHMKDLILETPVSPTYSSKDRNTDTTKDDSSWGMNSLSQFEEEDEKIVQFRSLHRVVETKKVSFDSYECESDTVSDDESESSFDDASFDDLEQEMALVLNSFATTDKNRPIRWSYANSKF